jgi:hypothetical protein
MQEKWKLQGLLNSAKEQVWDMFKTKKDSTKSADSQKTSSISCEIKPLFDSMYTLHFDTLERGHNPFVVSQVSFPYNRSTCLL